MKGIRYVTDENNKKVAVQIDLEEYGELWQDFYDYLLSVQRKDDESETLDDVVKNLRAAGKLDEDL